MQDTLNNDEFKRLLLSWPDRAVQYLYALHRSGLVRSSEQRTHNRKDAEDIVQEAFADLWEKHREIGGKQDIIITPYLYRMVKNKSITHYNRSQQINETQLAEEPAGESRTEAQLISTEEVEALWKVLASLPVREKQCIVMRYFQEMGYEEIATNLGVTVKAVERSMTSARKRLRKYRGEFF